MGHGLSRLRDGARGRSRSGQATVYLIQVFVFAFAFVSTDCLKLISVSSSHAARARLEVERIERSSRAHPQAALSTVFPVTPSIRDYLSKPGLLN